MGIGEFFFGKRQEQPIDIADISEHNTANQEGEVSFEKQAITKEDKMLEAKAVGRRKQLMKKALLAISLLTASPVVAFDFNPNQAIDSAERAYEAIQRVESDRIRAGQYRHESDNRLEESKHRDNAYTRQTLGRESEETQRRKVEVSGRVEETETRETEESRRHVSDRGVYEVGHKTENVGSFGKNRRERSGDAVSIDQMRQGGVPTSPLAGEERTTTESNRPSTERGGGLSERERDVLADRAVKDHENGLPSPDFRRTMGEAEREVYGHAWNRKEGQSDRQHKTGITLYPPR